MPLSPRRVVSLDCLPPIVSVPGTGSNTPIVYSVVFLLQLCKNLDAYDTTHRFPAVYAELGDGFIELLQFPPVRLEVGIFLGDPLLLFGDGR